MKNQKRFAVTALCVLLFVLSVIGLSSCIAKKCSHEWGEWSVTKQATCTEAGEQQHTCSKCGESESQAVEAGHSYGTWINEVAKTCTSAGVAGHYHCDACGKNFDADRNELTDLTIAGGHDYAVSFEVAGTCQTLASKTYTCKLCHDSYTETASALADHDWHDTTTLAATCQSGGYTIRECSVCHTKENYNRTDITACQETETILTAPPVPPRAKQSTPAPPAEMRERCALKRKLTITPHRLWNPPARRAVTHCTPAPIAVLRIGIPKRQALADTIM